MARSLTLRAVNVTTIPHADYQNLPSSRAFMRRAAAFIYLAALLALTGCQPPGPKALLEGDRLIGEGKYREAIDKLQTATQLLPANAQAWNHLGLAYQYAGQPNEALKAYQQAVSLDRNLAAIRFNLGTLHLEQNRLDQAMVELTSATVLDKNSVPAWVQLGKAQLRARRVDEAERSFAIVLALDQNNAEALNYLGVVQLHRRKAREAQAYFNASLKNQPDYSPAVLNQAVLFHQYIVNKTNALAKYKEYLAMKTDAAGEAAAKEAVRVLEAELQPKTVVHVPTNAPSATNRAVAVATNRPAPTVTNVAAAPATNRVETTNAIKVAALPKPEPHHVVVTNTPPPAPKNTVVSAPVVTNKPVVIEKPLVAEKPAEIEKPKLEEPKEPAKPLEVVNVAEEFKIATAKDISEPKPAQPRPKPAEVDTKPKTVATKTTPTTPTTATPPAPETNAPPPLIRSAARPPEEKSSLLKKANPLNWFKRDKKEGEEEPKTVAAKPAPSTTDKSSDLKALPEPPKEALPEIKPEPVFARYPYRTTPLPSSGNRAAAEAPYNEGVTAHQEGKLGKAMDSYRAALRQDPRFFEAHLNLGIAAAQSSDLSLALASFEDAVRIDPKSAEARYQFAMALRRANYPQDAINELKTLIDDSPNEARAYLALGNLYAQVLNKPEEAAANYQKLLQLSPQHPQAPAVRAWLSQH